MLEPPLDDRMSTASRPAHLLATACLVVATLLAALPAPAAALEPPKPLPGYRPEFVTETDTRPWTDCLWASGAMLLDKWTNGEVQVTRQALRRASGDRRGGSTLDNLKVAFAKKGFKLRFSPDGGTRITWGQMLSRLERGAGAVLLGDDSRLPRWYGRWDYSFWKKTGKGDNHAVYIERYDRRRGRVWLMDPLARGNWKGEWISTRSLRRFAWSRGGAIYVAMTPRAKPAPFAGVRIAPPKVVLSSTAVDAAWSLRTPRKWRFQGADVKAEFAPASDPLLAAALSPAVPVKSVPGEPPTRGRAMVTGKTLHVTAPLPTDPGAYVGRLSLRERRFGKTVAKADRIAVFVPGDRRATVLLSVRRSGVEAGSGLNVAVNVANTGTETWADSRSAGFGVSEEAMTRTTRVEARWIPLEVPEAAAGSKGTAKGGTAAKLPAADAPDPESVVLRVVPLAAGRMVLVRETILVPDRPGRWALVIDIVDDVDGSYAALGSAPAVRVIEVAAPRVIERGN